MIPIAICYFKYRFITFNMSQTIQKKYYSIDKEHSYLRYHEDDFYSKNLITYLLDFISVTKQNKILEIGAGAGRFTLHLLKAGYNVDCVDISKTQLNRLKEDAIITGIPIDKLRTYCMPIENMAVDSTDRYDVIIGFFILHHLDIDNLEIYFSKFKEIIKNNGKICFLEPNRLNPLFFLQVLIQEDMDFEGERGMFILSKGKLKKAVLSSKYRSVDFKNFGFFPPQIINRFPQILKFERMIEKLPLLNRLLPFILIGTKYSD